MSFKQLFASLVLAVSITNPAAATPPSATPSCRTCIDCESESAATKVIRLRTYNQTRLDDAVFGSILDVANSIWAPYGITVEAGTTADAVTVILSGGTLRGLAETPIAVGDTLFTQGHATPYIHLWLGAAERLARGSDTSGLPFTSKPPLERDAVLVRMLGVALAHELGHYLLDTSNHSSGGLLRRTMTARELEEANPARFRLTRKQLQLMCERPRTNLGEQR